MTKMKYFKSVGLSSLALVGVLLFWRNATREMGAIAQVTPPPTPAEPTLAEQAHLSTEQLEALAEFGQAVAVPASVPDGFAVAAVEVLAPDETAPDPFDASYRIVYQQALEGDATPACFEIEGAVGGFGGPVPPEQMDASLPEFAQVPADYTYQLFWSDGTDDTGPFPIPLLFSDWIEGESAFYRVSSWATATNGCDRIAPATANAILESLQYLPQL